MKKSTKPTELKGAAATAKAEIDAKSHTALFSQAMRLFRKGDFAAARQVFEQASQGPQLSVNESARMYARICQQRTERTQPKLVSAEDHYNYAVAMINAQRFSEALRHLSTALTLGDGAHIRYALALASGREGDIPGAAAQLGKAIELDHSVKALARRDADFHPLLEHAVLRQLVSGDKIAG